MVWSASLPESTPVVPECRHSLCVVCERCSNHSVVVRTIMIKPVLLPFTEVQSFFYNGLQALTTPLRHSLLIWSKNTFNMTASTMYDVHVECEK